MSLKVVGAGVGRTGTASLKQALEELLGGCCHHMFEVIENPEQIPSWAAAGEMPDWNELLKDYVALVDWPGASFWPELSEAFPDAIVLLSVRDAEKWYASAIDTIFRAESDHADLQLMWRAITKSRFCDVFEDKAKMMAAMQAHNDAVKAAIVPGRLLVWQVTDGWEPLCQALDVPVPDRPFPRTNTKSEFLGRGE